MENKMTIRQLRNAVCSGIGDLIVHVNNVMLQSIYDDDGKSRVELTNVMCSYDAIMSMPINRLDFDSGKFIAMVDIPVAALAGMAE